MREIKFRGLKEHGWVYGVGAVSNSDGYLKVKVAEPNKWRLKHHLVWESVNGKIPKGYCLRFNDGNKKNLSLDNLLLVDYRENYYLNRNSYKEAPKQLKPVVLAVSKLEAKIKEATNP